MSMCVCVCVYIWLLFNLLCSYHSSIKFIIHTFQCTLWFLFNYDMYNIYNHHTWIWTHRTWLWSMIMNNTYWYAMISNYNNNCTCYTYHHSISFIEIMVCTTYIQQYVVYPTSHASYKILYISHNNKKTNLWWVQ